MRRENSVTGVADVVLLGILSILQVTFLPGFLLVQIFRLADGLIKCTVLSLILSLLTNHFLVVGLTAVGWYHRGVVLAIFLMETLVLCYYLFLRRRDPLETLLAADVRLLVTRMWDWRGEGTLRRIVGMAMFLSAMLTLVYFGARAIGSVGQVFNSWDDVVSWNRWAVDWSSGHFPAHTWRYPQLLPANWSLTYLFIGTSSLQFFAKAIMPLFMLLILLLQLDLWLRSGNTGYLAAIPVTGFMHLIVNGVQGVMSGYADIPVAFMAFATLYILHLQATDESGETKGRAMISAGLCCAAAGLTKQAGLYLLCVLPLLGYFLLYRSNRLISAKRKALQLAGATAMAALLIAPCYIYTDYRIRSGVEQSEIGFVTKDIHGGKNPVQRLLASPYKLVALIEQSPQLNMIFELITFRLFKGVYVGIFLFAMIFILALIGLLDPGWRTAGLIIAVPFSLIWGMFFSYDLRNLSLAVPVIGCAAGIGLNRLFPRSSACAMHQTRGATPKNASGSNFSHS
ncbi:MAG TPA: hypothetical protein VIU41_15130, partial [Geobacteraceae bacterium]